MCKVQVRRKDFWMLSTTQKILHKFIPQLCHEADGLILQVFFSLLYIQFFVSSIFFSSLSLVMHLYLRIMHVELKVPLCFLFCRVGMIRMCHARMKVFSNGNMLT